MTCVMCRRTCKDELCQTCADTYIWEDKIEGYRIKKNRLIHEHRRESRLRKILKGLYGAENVLEEVAFTWCASPKTGALLRFDFCILQDNDKFILLEFNGEQHYKYNKFFHSSKSEFEDQKKRDAEKRKMCKKRQICLIEIPYTTALSASSAKRIIIQSLSRRMK